MKQARWMGVGRSSAEDPAIAAKEAVAGAITGSDPQLLIAFCSSSYDIHALVAALNEQSGGVALIGCSTSGEIGSSGPGDSSVVVTALGGPGFSVSTAYGAGASSRPREAGVSAAGCLTDTEEKPHRVLLLLSDGLSGHQQEILRGAYTVAGATIPLVGGCAGDDLAMSQTFQFCGNEVLTDAVVAAAVASDAPLGIGVRHGWSAVGEPMVVTKSSGNRVEMLDNKPALDAYLDFLDAPDEARTDPAAFTRFAITHPLGLSRRSAEPHVRFVGEADFETRSLICIAEVPQGALVWFMRGDEESVLEATDGACTDAIEMLDSEPLGFVAFDCIARRGVLGEEGIKVEVDRISELAGGAPVAGFYTYGEIARTRGISGFHNQTLVVLAVS